MSQFPNLVRQTPNFVRQPCELIRVLEEKQARMINHIYIPPPGYYPSQKPPDASKTSPFSKYWKPPTV